MPYIYVGVEPTFNPGFLTHSERLALARIKMAGEKGIQFDQGSALDEAANSLGRFRLVKAFYDHDPADNPQYKGQSRGWCDRITDLGLEWHEKLAPRSYKCCEFAILTPCVCIESVFCPIGGPEHNGGCHGTHD